MSLMGVAGVLGFATPAPAQTPVASANFNGYASGAVAVRFAWAFAGKRAGAKPQGQFFRRSAELLR